jgi:hypothetical protein
VAPGAAVRRAAVDSPPRSAAWSAQDQVAQQSRHPAFCSVHMSTIRPGSFQIITCMARLIIVNSSSLRTHVPLNAHYVGVIVENEDTSSSPMPIMEFF